MHDARSVTWVMMKSQALIRSSISVSQQRSFSLDHVAQASLVASDRLYGAKKQVLDSMGMASPEEFPITTDGMPLQLLSYLRLARLQDPAELAKARSGGSALAVYAREIVSVCVLVLGEAATMPGWHRSQKR